MDEPRQAPPQLAEWWPRVGATLLDMLIVGVLGLPVLLLGGALEDLSGASEGLVGWLVILLWFAVGSVYVSLLMRREGEHNGQTLGKQAAKIRVVRDDGQPLAAGTAFVRNVLLKYVVANVVFGIGWMIDSLWPLGESQNRALHDFPVHTHVVTTSPQAQPVPRPSRPQPALALAPPIARHIDAARRIQAGIAEAVQRAQLPYAEVSREVDTLMGLLWQSAQRAQMLYEALEETPAARIEKRLAAVDELQDMELAGALREQLLVQQRMQGQLQRFDSELERIVVELDTVRANLISVSASGDTANQERIAEAVRNLRDEMSAVSEGMDAAYRT